MKKSILLVAALSLCMVAKAWEVGDYYDVDGVPSVVIWVDETGEHGLRLSPAASSSEFDPKGNMYYKDDGLVVGAIKKNVFTGDIVVLATTKKAKEEATARWEKYHKRYEDLAGWYGEHLWENNKERTKKVQEIDITELLASNCEYGETNMKSILEFCDKNGYDMKTYFPSHYWATTIGDKWFIPGAHEAELISQSVTKGLGQPDPADDVKHATHVFYEKIGGKYFTLHYSLEDMLSSTFISSDWAKDPANDSKIGYFTEDDKTIPEENYMLRLAGYKGDESRVSLALRCILYVPPFAAHNMTRYYLMMKNSEPSYVHAVCYF